MKFINKLLLFLSSTAVFSFWIMYGVISYYNRFASDDFSMISLANHKGVLGGTIWFYFHWTGGFFGTLFQTLTLYLIQWHKSLLFYNLFLLLLISSALYFALSEIFTYNKIQISRWVVLLVSQLLIHLLFFSGFSISENWFWVVGSTAYIYPICIVLISIGCYFKYLNTGRFTFMFSSLITLLFFGSYPVNYVSLYLFICSVWILLKYYQSKKIHTSSIFYLTFLLIGFAINVVAPGNYVRKSAVTANLEHHYTFWEQMIGMKMPIYVLQKIITPYNLILVICFGLPIISLMFFRNENWLKLEKKTAIKIFAICFGIMTIAILSNLAINYIALGWGLGSYRSMMPISIFFILTSLAVISVLALYTNSLNFIKTTSCLALILCIYRSTSILIKQHETVKHYASKHDERISIILEAKKSFTGNILYLDSLPSSGILLSAEIGKDTSNYVNVDMKSCFDLPFTIAVK